jgi:hypothetical protein
MEQGLAKVVNQAEETLPGFFTEEYEMLSRFNSFPL